MTGTSRTTRARPMVRLTRSRHIGIGTGSPRQVSPGHRLYRILGMRPSVGLRVPVVLVTVVAAIAGMAGSSPASAGGSGGTWTRGVSLTIHLSRTTYPRDALAAIPVTLHNGSDHPVVLQGVCTGQNPSIRVSTTRGRAVDPGEHHARPRRLSSSAPFSARPRYSVRDRQRSPTSSRHTSGGAGRCRAARGDPPAAGHHRYPLGQSRQRGRSHRAGAPCPLPLPAHGGDGTTARVGAHHEATWHEGCPALSRMDSVSSSRSLPPLVLGRLDLGAAVGIPRVSLSLSGRRLPRPPRLACRVGVDRLSGCVDRVRSTCVVAISLT